MVPSVDPAVEDPAYLTQQLITCLGNKRNLLPLLGQGLELVCRDLSRTHLKLFDVFSGSGIVSRFFKRYASWLLANDLEHYSFIINSCYLSNASQVPSLERARAEVLEVATRGAAGFISELYAPQDDQNIQPGERVFYTTRNARFLDAARQAISAQPAELQPYLLAPLLAEASIHANTSGVFKGFHRDAKSGVGAFGGQGRHALSRILGEITLPLPVLSRYEVPFEVLESDANTAAKLAPPVDVAYLDPPYNQHPYGSNYFMLNLLARYERPQEISPVSGIPRHWNRSAYNRPQEIRLALTDLIENLKAKFILVSFNSEGFLSREDLEDLMRPFGNLTVLEQSYPAFRGSRNLAQRKLQVQEYLFVLHKSRAGAPV